MLGWRLLSDYGYLLIDGDFQHVEKDERGMIEQLLKGFGWQVLSKFVQFNRRAAVK